jgi:hypothetical protein
MKKTSGFLSYLAFYCVFGIKIFMELKGLLNQGKLGMAIVFDFGDNSCYKYRVFII